MTPLASQLLTIIAALRPLTAPGSFEHHYLVSGEGAILSHLVGDENEIVTGLPNEALHDATTIHNHPGSEAFPPSENDIVNALACGERATFVVNVAGIARFRCRWPVAGEEDRYRALLDSAETLETRAARRLGWYGGQGMPRRLFNRLPAMIEAEIHALVAAYPEFSNYAFVPHGAPASALLGLLELG